MASIVAQKAVIQKNGGLLILHRAETESAYPGLWDFPGGRLEPDENLIDSVKREVKEETNLTIDVKSKLGEYDGMIRDRHVHFIIYSAEVLEGKLKIGEEHSEYRWAKPNEILELPSMPFMKQFISDYKLTVAV